MMKLATVAMALALSLPVFAQKSVGTVAAGDVSVISGAGAQLTSTGSRVELSNSSAVTANPGRNADIALTRGGLVKVCMTSVLHTTQSGDALLLALDRGAMEIRMKAQAADVVMTPDLRFTLGGAGTLDLQMRVSASGDTCVDNRGHRAPLLKITDSFGESSYELKPGQHVMFEHGSLREVVDRETVPCGCPPETQPGMSIAEAMLNKPGTTTAKEAAEAHPFPAAVSEGLAAPAAIAPETPAGAMHVQVGATLTFDPTEKAAPKGPATAQPDAAAAALSNAAPMSAAPEKHGPLAAIGHFFKRMFVR